LPDGRQSETAQLENAVGFIGKLAVGDDQAVVAAHCDEAGHWSFVSRTGERFTAANPAEVQNAWRNLVPQIGEKSERLTILLTPDTVMQRGERLKDLPQRAALRMPSGDSAYELESATSTKPAHLRLRPRMYLDVPTQTQFSEVMWHLRRPINKARIRMLSMQSGGPGKLTAEPRQDPVSKKPLVDMVDPVQLPGAFSAIRGQTALILGRQGPARLSGWTSTKETDPIYVQAGDGKDMALDLPALRRSAAANAVTLVVLLTTSAAQPGGRNWLWQRVEVKGLETAVARPTFADFLEAMAWQTGLGMRVETAPDGERARTDLFIRHDAALAGSTLPSRVVGAMIDLAAEAVGKLSIVGVKVTLPESRRQREMDRRFVMWLPSTFQWAYTLALVLGMLGAATSWRWWRSIWPEEKPAEYASRPAYWAARGVRAIVYALIFLPLSAPVSLPMGLIGLFKPKAKPAN
jgi:hypothetical protein